MNFYAGSSGFLFIFSNISQAFFFESSKFLKFLHRWHMERLKRVIKRVPKSQLWFKVISLTSSQLFSSHNLWIIRPATTNGFRFFPCAIGKFFHQFIFFWRHFANIERQIFLLRQKDNNNPFIAIIFTHFLNKKKYERKIKKKTDELRQI